MPTAALYLRLSKKKAGGAGSDSDERTEASLETQEASCRRYAAAHGFVIAESHIYREVHSGLELWERPQLTALREAMKARNVSVVIVHAVDRLARDAVHLGVVLSEADHVGAQVHFATETIDATPEGELVRYVRAYAAKVEHEKIRERVQRAKLAAVQAGKRFYGPRPNYGLAWADAAKSGLLADPETGPVVRRLFIDAHAGVPCLALALRLTEAGIPTPSGGAVWEPSTVQYLLRNPVYKGELVARRFKRERVPVPGGRKWRQRVRSPDEQYVLKAYPVEPLVTPDVWAAVQEQLARNKAGAPRSAAEPDAYLLRGGFVRCGTCGGLLHGQRDWRGRYRYYKCQANRREPGRCASPAMVRADTLDAFVWANVEQMARDFLERAGRLRPEPPQPRGAATAARLVAQQRAARERRIANLTARLAEYAPGDPLAEPYEAQLQREVEARAREAARQPAPREDDAAQRARAQEASKRIVDGLASVAERRRALAELAVEVVAWPRTHQPPYGVRSRLVG